MNEDMNQENKNIFEQEQPAEQQQSAEPEQAEEQKESLYEPPQAEAAESEETPQQEPEESQAEKDDRERNLVELRKKAEQAQRERDEAMGYVRQVMQMQQQPQRSQPHQQKEEEITYSDDDLIEGKHLKREREKYNQQLEEIRKEFQTYKQQAQVTSLENRLKSEYKDIEQVLTKENIHAFRQANPNLAKALAYSPDPYGQAVETYKQIKALGIGNSAQYEPERQRVKKNSAKPRAAASAAPQAGDSPLSKANAFANGLTREQRRQLWEDMKNKSRT